jgi:hypothetical protein
MSKLSRFGGIGGHHSNRAATVEWLTPPAILAAVGGADSFDLDPATPEVQPWPTAKHRYTRNDNGLMQRWFGRVFLNPPYTSDDIAKWMGRMADHNHGTALIFARTETDAFFRYVWDRASALLFMRGRVNFHHLDGTRASANSGAPTVLCAYGSTDADILACCAIDGQFVPLIFSRSVLVTALRDVTWSELVASVIEGATEPLRIADIWALVKDHPKARANQNARAKIRQTLQLGVGRPVSRDQWLPA